MRVSYVGELGWEIYAAAEHGQRLWDVLWESGQRLGVVAAGRAAFDSLRLEKGYRAWGCRHDQRARPLRGGRRLRGAAGVEGLVRGPRRARRRRRHDRHPPPDLPDRGRPLRGRPRPRAVLVDGVPSGHVTSAAFGHTVGRPIAYAWLPAGLDVGTRVDIRYFDRDVRARVAAEPLVDPEMARIRR